MKEIDIDKLFEEIRPAIDREEPTKGHHDRFLEKLKAGDTVRSGGISWWKPLAIAASVLFLVGLFLGNFTEGLSGGDPMAEIAPEVSNTELYFAAVIEEQLKLLEEENTPEAKRLVTDAMEQLANLEEDYNQQRTDLLDGGDYKIILSAMVQNFQTRIDLLEDVMQKVETVKNLKEQNDENFTI